MGAARHRRVAAKPEEGGTGPIRYAVVGLGYIAQVAVLPAFRHAAKNSRLVALVSDDPVKLKTLGRKYGVDLLCDYADYERCLKEVDAVYIALPNDLHLEYVLRAAEAGVHVLCEKPLGLDESECRLMIDAAARANVRLMTAYRLHFEKANLEAVELLRAGRIGEPRIFNSVFTMQVRDRENIRLSRAHGGGPVPDIGIYAINASRYLFQAEPTEVFAWSASSGDPRFEEVDEMTSFVLRFPEQRLASITCSFGAADVGFYQVIGTRGHLRVDPAYEYAGALRHELTVGTRTLRREFPRRDQFAAELLYFSECIQSGREPEPSGLEGLIDVTVIRGVARSAASGRPVKLDLPERERRPRMAQERRRAAVRKPAIIRARAPGKP